MRPSLKNFYYGEESNDFIRSRIDMYREHIAKKDEYVKKLIRIS